jgi:large subunit ribosomal protein L3
MQGLIGRKLGMTQVYDAKGRRVAVTVIEAGPCVVVQRKTRETDGYEAAQLGFADQKEHRMTKPAMGHLRKAGCGPKRVMREFGVDGAEEAKPGDAVTVSIFEGTTHVDVGGVTKGQGFQGVVGRHHMAGGPLTHGGHSKRRVGSIGANSYPARVAKGQRMPGHTGDVRRTQQNLEVVQVRKDENVLLVRGAIPGAVGSYVVVRKALKKAGKA